MEQVRTRKLGALGAVFQAALNQRPASLDLAGHARLGLLGIIRAATGAHLAQPQVSTADGTVEAAWSDQSYVHCVQFCARHIPPGNGQRCKASPLPGPEHGVGHS